MSQVLIGFEPYHCSCVRYAKKENTALIVGLPVGLALLLLIVVIIVVVILYRRYKSKKSGQNASDDNLQTSLDIGQEDRHYNRRLPGEYRETAMNEGYSRELPDYVESTDSTAKQYNRQLPEDYREAAGRDTEYSTQLPDDYRERAGVNPQYSTQLPDYAQSRN